MANAFARKNFGEAVGGPAVLPRAGAGAEVNVATRDLLVEPGITSVRDVVNGIVEEAVRGVVRAKRSAHRGDGNALCLAVVPNERNDFFTQVRIENGLDVAAVKWVCALVVEAEPIDRVHCEKFDSSGLDEISERADHALALEFPLVARAGRKTKERRAPMSEDNYA